MANITAGLVKELRERSGCGMMDCKKVLVEADGDIERAAELLREKGLAKAVKKSGRIAAEGIVASAVSEDGKTGVIVEVNCETDFVAKADPFRKFVDSIAKIILEKNPADVDALLALETAEGTVTDMLNEAVFKIGEKISIRRFIRIEGNVDTYIHMGGKIGVIVEADKEADKTAMHDVALQIAAAKPSYVRKEEVPAEEIEHEKMILREQALSEPKPKPEPIIEKMVLGRIQKYYKEVCLLEQPFVKDGDVSVSQMINNRFDIVKFARFEMGDGLEKRQDDFAAEVMAQIQK